METYLITGGAGFVGSSIALRLKQEFENIRVLALDNMRRRGSELNLERLSQAGVEFLHGDVRNQSDLNLASRVSTIIDCSAEPSVLAGYGGSPLYVVETNLFGTVNCLELARRDAADLIFLSTSRVYPMDTMREIVLEETQDRFELAAVQPIRGVTTHGITEGFPLDGRRSLYGATKLSSELLVAEYEDMYGLRAIVNRCGVLTGPWQMGKVEQGIVVLWAARHVYGGKLNYIGYGGTGKQVRDILHVDDLFDLLVTQLQNVDRFAGGTYNVGGGRSVSVSLLELTRLCQDITGRRCPIGREINDRVGDIPVYLSDHSKVSDLAGWNPRVGPVAIIEEIVRWLVDERIKLEPILSGRGE